jgi:signal transduction histidine kinase
LLENSINFTDSGSITVVVSQSGDLKDVIEVKIKDTGKGIDESIRDKLFQKFVTKSNRQKGTGIGLFLCKKIIEAHGGTIHGENNSDGGATFSFKLPVISV